VGFTAVLHAWDQEPNLHPHLHLVVTGGGLSEDGERWIPAGNSFLLPVRALSKIIRGKFLEGLEKAFLEGRLRGKVPGFLQNPGLAHDDDYENALRDSHNRLLHMSYVFKALSLT